MVRTLLSDEAWKKVEVRLQLRTCYRCSHVIPELHPSRRRFVVVSGCERGLQNSSYPYDEFEREPGVD
ncbi:hypothetical protein B7R77_17455 [Ralstonia solanacearum K60]|uniref:Uncharacterized protein n=1 Tax=Ralstonia solanacearum K60 TaxID=1091042 RepID=A0AAP8D5K2_RALSL|nr:hypothetical protein B7R77_17455 [Ralstonia solanacearum K60]RIJ85307.1 hypothetical protein RSP822_16235 [Ralstonia solanacearum]CCF95899.1 hypothetical protein RSK60_1210001 [Ralstonia solanacearum K60]